MSLPDVNETAAAAIYAGAAAQRAAKQVSAAVGADDEPRDGNDIPMFDDLPEEERKPYLFAARQLAKVLRLSNQNKAKLAFSLHDGVKAKFEEVPFNAREAVEIYFNIKAQFTTRNPGL